MLPTMFHVNWLFISEEVKNRFSRWWPWRPSWITDRNDYSYFCSTRHPDASYQVSSQLAFQFRRRSQKYIFKIAAMAVILDFRSEGLQLFLIYKSSRCFLPSFKSIGLSVQEKKLKIDFKDGNHLGFPIGTILAIFYERVTPTRPTKFQVSWPFGSGEEAKHRFSRWRPSWISDRNNFSYFWSISRPDAPIKFQVNSPLVQEKKRKIDFQDGLDGGILDF